MSPIGAAPVLATRGPLVVALHLLLLLAAATLAGQEPTFRSGVDLVQLDVVVLDRDRRPVTGLTTADFTVLEGSVPRQIEAFAAVTLPTPGPVRASTSPWTRDAVTDVISNQQIDEGRLVVLMLDRSIPAGVPTVAARAIARAAIDALGPTDVAAVVRTSGFSREGISQNFTSDRQRLLEAVDQPFVGLTAPPEMTFSGLQRQVPNLHTTGDCLCGSCVFDALEHVASSLSNQRGRKLLVFIGSAVVIQVRSGTPQMCLDSVESRRTAVFRAFDRANVTVHAIDPSGLDTFAQESDTLPADHGRRAAASERLERQGDLAVLPDYTGGRTVLDTNAPGAMVPDLFAESQSYYLLGFQRSFTEALDQFRDIRVRVARDDVTVHSRRGYFTTKPLADSDSGPGRIDDALAGALPSADVPLLLALVRRFGRDGTPELSVRLGIAGGTSDDYRLFDVRVVVLDGRGNLLGTEELTVEAEPSAVVSDVLEAHLTLPLPLGRYEVRVGVDDIINGRAGSVYGYVDVESDGSVPLGGITIHATPDRSAGASRVPAPTLRRTFTPADVVTAVTQVSRRDPATAAVDLSVRIVDVTGRIQHATTRAIEGFTPAGVADVTVPVPVADLPPGRYLLTIEVQHEGREQARDVVFEVTSS